MRVSQTVRVMIKMAVLSAFSLAATASGVIFPAGTALASGGSAAITLSPASGYAAPNTTFDVQVYENSGSSMTNAIEADLDFPAGTFEYVGVNDTGSAFPLAASTTHTSNSVSISRGVTGGSAPVSGNQLVTTVTFKMLTGSGAITINAASIVVDTSDGSNIFTSGTGTNFQTPPGCGGTCVPVHRFYNFKAGAHFYTVNESEKAAVLTHPETYRYEGVTSFAQPTQVTGTVPVHRFYNFKQGVHFYTSNQAEATNVNNTMYTTFHYEGIAYYTYTASATNLVPVYRFYNFKNGVHFYTSNEAEKQNVIDTAAWTFRYEGIAGYNIANL
jgi:hypothetical protein